MTELYGEAMSEDPRREPFVIALASGRTVNDSGTVAAVSRSTAQRWALEPGVIAEVDQLRAEIRQRTVALLAAGAITATEVLVEIATNKKAGPTARVSASRALLSESRAIVEMEDLRRRLDAIEHANGGGTDLRAELAALLTEPT